MRIEVHLLAINSPGKGINASGGGIKHFWKTDTMGISGGFSDRYTSLKSCFYIVCYNKWIRISLPAIHPPHRLVQSKLLTLLLGINYEISFILMFPNHVGATNHYQISMKPTCSARPGEDMRRDGQHFSARGCKVGSANVTSRPVLLFTFSLLCHSRAPEL